MAEIKFFQTVQFERIESKRLPKWRVGTVLNKFRFLWKFYRYTKKGKIMKIIVKLNGVIIYEGEITSYIPPSFVASKEKGYISNLLALIEKGSKKEWIKLKDGTTITITTL